MIHERDRSGIGMTSARTRERLVERLESRTRKMFSDGLLDEVRGLLAAGCTGDEKPFESLGYNQAIRHLRGEVGLEEAIESTFIETRQYAKRQRTWFRRDAEIHWLPLFGDDPQALPSALAWHQQVQRTEN